MNCSVEVRSRKRGALWTPVNIPIIVLSSRVPGIGITAVARGCVGGVGPRRSCTGLDIRHFVLVRGGDVDGVQRPILDLILNVLE